MRINDLKEIKRYALYSSHVAGGTTMIELTEQLREAYPNAVAYMREEDVLAANRRMADECLVSPEEAQSRITTVDLANADADGFRNGRASVVVELPKMYPHGETLNSSAKAAYNDAVRLCRRKIIAAGGSVKE